MIRLPNTPSLSPTQINAPAADPAAVGASAQALGTLARGIAAVAEPFAEHANRIQSIENARMESEARQQWARGLADLQLDLANEFDPAARLSKTQTFLDSIGGSFDTMDVSPEVRARLASQFSEFATREEIRAAADAAKLAETRAAQAFQNEYRTALARNDTDGARAALDTVSPFLSPEEQTSYAQEIDRTAALDVTSATVTLDPFGSLERLADPDAFLAENPGLVAADIPRLQRAAEQAIQDRRSDELDLLEAAHLAGQLTPDMITATEFLSEKDKAKLTHGLANPDALASPESHSQAWDALFTLRDAFADPSVTDAEYADLWNSTRADVLSLIPEAAQSDIKEELRYLGTPRRRNVSPSTTSDAVQSPDTGRTTIPTDVRREHATLAAQRIKQSFDLGHLGSVVDKNSPAYRDAYNRFEDARVAVKRYLAENPDADWPTVRKFIDAELGRAIEAADTVLIPSAPPAVTFDADLDRVLNPDPNNTPSVLPPRQ
jgi:hypothetical protein